MDIKWWNENKMATAPLASAVLWAISVVCFVFGLKFDSPMIAFGYNIGTIIAFALAMCNTIIQLIGNGMEFRRDDGVFRAIWIASYVLGISSNTNTLMQLVGMSSWWLEWAVSLSLGTIIEIAPEKLIILYLRSRITNRPKPKTNQHTQHPVRPIPPGIPRPASSRVNAPNHAPLGMASSDNPIVREVLNDIMKQQGKPSI